MSTGLILASASPRRSGLLQQIGASFEVWPADADESLEGALAPEIFAKQLAQKKAESVSTQIINGNKLNRKYDDYDEYIVIGADTIVVARDGAIYGKPADGADAKRMLQSLSGNWHEVYTGIALIALSKHDQSNSGLYRRGSVADYEATRVKMRALSCEEIDGYINTGEPGGKAGAYAIQGAGALFIERVEGCYFNVVGLPLQLLGKMLGTLGYDIFNNIVNI